MSRMIQPINGSAGVNEDDVGLADGCGDGEGLGAGLIDARPDALDTTSEDAKGDGLMLADRLEDGRGDGLKDIADGLGLGEGEDDEHTDEELTAKADDVTAENDDEDAGELELLEKKRAEFASRVQDQRERHHLRLRLCERRRAGGVVRCRHQGQGALKRH